MQKYHNVFKFCEGIILFFSKSVLQSWFRLSHLTTVQSREETTSITNIFQSFHSKHTPKQGYTKPYSHYSISWAIRIELHCGKLLENLDAHHQSLALSFGVSDTIKATKTTWKLLFSLCFQHCASWINQTLPRIFFSGAFIIVFSQGLGILALNTSCLVPLRCPPDQPSWFHSMIIRRRSPARVSLPSTCPVFPCSSTACF